MMTITQHISQEDAARMLDALENRGDGLTERENALLKVFIKQVNTGRALTEMQIWRVAQIHQRRVAF